MDLFPYDKVMILQLELQLDKASSKIQWMFQVVSKHWEDMTKNFFVFNALCAGTNWHTPQFSSFPLNVSSQTPQHVTLELDIGSLTQGDQFTVQNPLNCWKLHGHSWRHNSHQWSFTYLKDICGLCKFEAHVKFAKAQCKWLKWHFQGTKPKVAPAFKSTYTWKETFHWGISQVKLLCKVFYFYILVPETFSQPLV